MSAETKRRRSERLEVRTTVEERSDIDRAVAATGSDLTEFVVSNPTIARGEYSLIVRTSNSTMRPAGVGTRSTSDPLANFPASEHS